jgi:hypothetical protein
MKKKPTSENKKLKTAKANPSTSRTPKKSAASLGKKRVKKAVKSKRVTAKTRKTLSPDHPSFTVSNRYGEPRTLTRVDNCTAQICGDTKYVRFCTNHETGLVDMVDFEGGPCIIVGDRIAGAGIVTEVEKWEYRNQPDQNSEHITVTFKHDASG